MFEKMSEMLRDQPDWLEVSFPPGTLDQVKERLKPSGLSPEQAVTHFIQSLLRKIGKDADSMSAFQMCDRAADDIAAQFQCEPSESFYRVELPNYALPGFVSFPKSYYGTFAEISALITSLDESHRCGIGDIVLTPVHIMATRTSHKTEFSTEHTNIYGWPHQMSCKALDSVHVWIKNGDQYHRCIRARLEDLTCQSTLIDEAFPITGAWGFPNMVSFIGPYTFNRLFELEKSFDTWAETEQDIRAFDGDICLTELFNDIFADG